MGGKAVRWVCALVVGHAVGITACSDGDRVQGTGELMGTGESSSMGAPESSSSSSSSPSSADAAEVSSSESTGDDETTGGAQAGIVWGGVNLAGAEFGSTVPGTFGVDYIYPGAEQVDYFSGKGMNLFRLPFRWERLQETAHGSFDPVELGRIVQFVAEAKGAGAQVLLNPHNYARYYGEVVGQQVEIAVFADFWGKLAAEFSGDQAVLFGLMNEPHDMPTELWIESANAAISAIRDAGADNWVVVPGNAWSGAWSWDMSWYGTPNATAMLEVEDPLDRLIIEVHQYLDADHSGTSEHCVSETIGPERLATFTQWGRRYGYRALLGEIGVGRNDTCDMALDATLAYLETNDDVWIGWTYWAAGPWWGEYIYTIEPNDGMDRPQMNILESYLPP